MFPLFGIFGIAELVLAALTLLVVGLAAFDTFWPVTVGLVIAAVVCYFGWVAVPALS